MQSTFEKNLKYYCELRGLTLKELASEIGMSETTLHLSKKRLVNDLELAFIAGKLKVDPSDLLSEKEPINFVKGWGSKLRYYRKKMGLTQTQLGKKIGYSRYSIAEWENEDSEPSRAACDKLSEFLKVSAQELFSSTDDIREPSFEDLIAQLVYQFHKLKDANLNNNGITLTTFETNLIMFLRSLPETDKLLKLYTLTGDQRYLQQYNSLVSKTPTSSQDTSLTVNSSQFPTR